MKSIFNFLIIALLGLSVSFCSSTPETAENTNDQPKYEDYSSSGIYKDIQGESRGVSSEDYEDDDYGDAGSAGDEEQEEVFLGGDNVEDESEPEAIPEPPKEIAELPVEKILEDPEPAPPVKKKARRKGNIARFKNGMYKFSKACYMRKSPSKSAGTDGKVSTKRKLWVEGHNSNWVTVQKKSGAVYVHKTCL